MNDSTLKDLELENENQLNETQIYQLKIAFDKLFKDYECIFGGKSDNYDFVKYYGWLNKCNQVIGVLQRTDKVNFICFY